MQTTLTGKRLLAKLAECPADALPHGVSQDGEGCFLVHSLRIDQYATLIVTDNVRNRDAESVNTIDSDWSVSLDSLS